MDDRLPSTIEFEGHNIEFYEGLTDMQCVYVYWRKLGYTPGQAAKKTGYSAPAQAKNVNEQNPKIRMILEEYYSKNRVEYKIDRHAIIGGMLEALSVARERSDAKTMLEAWDKIGEVTGEKAPEKKEIVHSHQGQIDHNHIHAASDKELLALIHKERELPEIIDGEYEEVKELEYVETGQGD